MASNGDEDQKNISNILNTYQIDYAKEMQINNYTKQIYII